MSNPIDEETYGDRGSDNPQAVGNGNPGKPQSDYEFDEAEPDKDPSEFPEGSGEVVAGTVAPTDAQD